MLKGKEVISDPQRQYEIARDLHHKSHGGINKTTASIAESYHWVRIKETVSQVIRNCPECSEMNKGLSAVRAQQQSRYVQPSNPSQMPARPPPIQHFSQPAAPQLERPDSPSNQLQLEAAQHHDPFASFHTQQHNFDLPVDPALMDGMHPMNLEDLPPSPFLNARQSVGGGLEMPGLELPGTDMGPLPRLDGDGMDGVERAPTAGAELRRRLTRAGFSQRG